MSLDGMKRVVTGKFSRGRKLIEADLEAAGASVSGSVTGSTQLLICGEKAGSKLAKAEKLGVPVIDEAQMLALIGGTPVEEVVEGGGSTATAEPSAPKPVPAGGPASAFLEGKAWLIYGRMESMSKSEIADAIKARGGRVISSVSSKLDFLLHKRESLLPGDDAWGWVKPEDALAMGAACVGEADLLRLIEGDVPPKLAAHASAKETAAKEPPKKKARRAAAKKSKTLEPLTVAVLLERTISAISGLDSKTWAQHPEEAAAVVRVCAEAGLTTEAAQLVAAAPDGERGHLQLTMALSAGGDIDAAVTTILDELDQLKNQDPPRAVETHSLAYLAALRRIVDAAGKIGDRSPAAQRLEAVVDAFLDEAFDAGEFVGVAGVLWRKLARGEGRLVRKMLKRWLEQDSASLKHQLGDYHHAGLRVLIFPKDPKTTFALANLADRDLNGKDLSGLVGWSFADIETFTSLCPGDAVERVYAVLAEAGRTEEAAKLLMENADDSYYRSTRASRLHMLGKDEEAVESLKQREPASGEERAWATLRFELGLQSFTEMWTRQAACSLEESGPMAEAGSLMSSATYLMDHDLDEELAPILSAVESSFTKPVNGRRGQEIRPLRYARYDRLRARALTRAGDLKALRTWIESDIKNFKTLKGSPEAGGRLLDPWKLFDRAIEAEMPDLAIRAIKKVTKRDRPEPALKLFGAVLSAQPALALNIYDTYIDGYRLLLHVSLSQLWEAVLAQGTA